MSTPLVGSLIFIFGLMSGSFINVCIYRLPLDESIVFPGSHCRRCSKPIPWYDNIPLISFLALAGKCRFCRAPISWRYFGVELLCGVMGLGFWMRLGWSPFFVVYLLFAYALVATTFIDWDHQIIPDQISLSGLVLGFILSYLFPVLHGEVSRIAAAGRSLLGILVGGGSLYLLAIVGEKLFRKEAMGGGDIKLLAMLGSILGARSVFFIIFISSLIGSVAGLGIRFFTKQEKIAFGPYLSMAALVVMLFSKAIWEGYRRWIFQS